MPLYTEPNLSAGIDDVLVSTAESVPAFPIMILVFLYCLVLMGGASAQRRRTGFADIPFWNVLAAITTMMLALLMTIGEGMINLITLGIVVAITIMSGVWFFLSKVRGEQ